MNAHHRIDLDEFFFSVTREIYCVIKINEKFPDYSPGDDIDVFCYDSVSFSKKILACGNRYVDEGFEIRVTSAPGYQQTHIDFYYMNKLEFRFDLYNSLPAYRSVRIRPGLFSSIIENAVPKRSVFQAKEYSLYVPDKTDEMLIRYIEFLEWYRQRPDKIRHLEYIIANIDENARITFLDKLHYYTGLPDSNCVEIIDDDKNRGISRSFGWDGIVNNISFFIIRPIKLLVTKVTKKQ